jgi:hypothetical protein
VPRLAFALSVVPRASCLAPPSKEKELTLGAGFSAAAAGFASTSPAGAVAVWLPKSERIFKDSNEEDCNSTTTTDADDQLALANIY